MVGTMEKKMDCPCGRWFCYPHPKIIVKDTKDRVIGRVIDVCDPM